MSARHLKDVRDHRCLTPHGQSKENRSARKRFARALKQRDRHDLTKDIAESLLPDIIYKGANYDVTEHVPLISPIPHSHLVHATADKWGVTVTDSLGATATDSLGAIFEDAHVTDYVYFRPACDAINHVADLIDNGAIDMPEMLLAPSDIQGFHSVRLTRGGNLRGVKTLASDINHSLATAAA